MSGLLANLVGVATAALNLRSQEAPTRAPKEGPQEGGFASALATALSPQQRSKEATRTEESSGVRRSDAGTEDAAVSTSRADGHEGPAAVDKASAEESAVSGPSEAEASAASAEIAGPGPIRRSPTSVDRSVEGLNAEFRARLERVIHRMETEHGHDVQIVETVRDQSRQEYLYAQGRTRPGPVVTWTKSSNHSHGRAADLLVDGTYDNPLAMVRLARIAREEGLRTLGARDPGHVELPAGVRVDRMVVGADATSSLLDGAAARGAEAARVAAGAQEAGVAQASPSGQVGGVAAVARVAAVAQVAQVATVARVATPGSPGTGAAEAPAAPVVAPEQGPAPTAVAGQLASSGGDSAGEDGRREGRSSNREPVKEASGDAGPRVLTGTPFGTESRASSAAAAEVRGAPATFGAEAAERIARVLQLQDTAPTRPLSQMVLRLDNAAGGEDTIRVDLRGSSVGASLNVGDPVAASRLQSELGQLQRALEGRGLQAEHLSVTGGLAGRELVDALRTALPADAGQRGSHDPESQREGWNGRQGGRPGDSDADNPRQRPRQDSQQERNT